MTMTPIPTFMARCNPALCAGTFRTQAVGTVGTFQEVEEVVDEVGGDLHTAGKEHTAEREQF